ncbi:MAG: hypothetical protein PHD88_05470 [Firmicutes bacterium]|nr:hypothetical protein [Bacillota bacterium]
MKLAVSHLNGQESLANTKGFNAYPALSKHFEVSFDPNASWNMEYYLGTYGGLKYFAYKYLDKMNQSELAKLYERTYELWREAFVVKKSENSNSPKVKAEIAGLLQEAYERQLT